MIKENEKLVSWLLAITLIMVVLLFAFGVMTDPSIAGSRAKVALACPPRPQSDYTYYIPMVIASYIGPWFK